MLNGELEGGLEKKMETARRAYSIEWFKGSAGVNPYHDPYDPDTGAHVPCHTSQLKHMKKKTVLPLRCRI